MLLEAAMGPVFNCFMFYVNLLIIRKLIDYLLICISKTEISEGETPEMREA